MMIHPRKTQQLWGHTQARRIFLQAMEQKKLAHAWLVEGRKGIGKATFVYSMIKKIMASGSVTAMNQIEAGSFPDLMEVGRRRDEKKDRLKNEIIVEDIRAVSHFLHQTPALAGWRIVVIDEAETMNRNAANSLLKILEEPPSKALVFLITSASGRLLPTIRSRCARLSLSPLTSEEMDQALSIMAGQYSHQERQQAAFIAEGAPGYALMLLENNGLSIANSIESLLEGKMETKDIYKEIDGFLKPEGGFELFMTLLMHKLGKKALSVIDHGADSSAAEKNNVASEAFFYASLWHKVNSLYNTTEQFNLDKRQALFSIFDLARAV